MTEKYLVFLIFFRIINGISYGVLISHRGLYKEDIMTETKGKEIEKTIKRASAPSKIGDD